METSVTYCKPTDDVRCDRTSAALWQTWQGTWEGQAPLSTNKMLVMVGDQKTAEETRDSFSTQLSHITFMARQILSNPQQCWLSLVSRSRS